MSTFAEDKAQFLAIEETILNSTVGIGLGLPGKPNVEVGTGTCISYKNQRYILTAAHVVDGYSLDLIRLFLRPPLSIVEGSIADGLHNRWPVEAGDYFAFGAPLVDSANDVAVLPLLSTDLFPKYMTFISIDEITTEIPDDTSVVILGCPVDNSLAIAPQARVLGLSSSHARFSVAQQKSNDLPSSFDTQRHFVFHYALAAYGVKAPGFSGAGAWCFLDTKKDLWHPKALLVGVMTSWIKKKELALATKIQICQSLLNQHANSN